MRARPWLALVLCVSSACGIGASAGTVTVSGVLYVDLEQDARCVDLPPIEDLAGVTLRFLDGAGTLLATARTGPVAREELPPGDGKVGWTSFGCRFAASYAVELPPADEYEIRFTPSRNDAATNFVGVEMLEPQRVRYADLEANGFRWSVDVVPAYVVP